MSGYKSYEREETHLQKLRNKNKKEKSKRRKIKIRIDGMPEGNEDGSMKYFIFILKYPQSLK